MSGRRWVLALVGVFGLMASGCEGDEPSLQDVDASLPTLMPADQPQSCSSCHPRQVMEWAGSSHNYGSGLDGSFQALELTANYWASHLPPPAGFPLFRRNLLCMTCHAPSLGAYRDGKLDINATLRQGFFGQPDDLDREVPFPADNEDLVMPVGRAIELAAAAAGGADDPTNQRLLSFQGISCDDCHKVGIPHDDRNTPPPEPGYTACIDGEEPAACAARQFEECAGEKGMFAFRGRCVRRSRGQDPHGEPFVETNVANIALVLERTGSTRYGPFPVDGPEGEQLVATNTAHGVSSGASEEARNYNRARYADGRPFEDQPADVAPFIKSSQFCGTCHDVRLQPAPETILQPVPGQPEVGLIDLSNMGLSPDDPNFQVERNDNLEPVHNEPFLRLENLYTEWYISGLNLHPARRGAENDPRLQFPDNPYRNADGSARRVVCQDCHMSLFTYAPPGTSPGIYTHPDDCDANGDCGVLAATAGARSNERIHRRARISTHNMTGVDIALGSLVPIDPLLLQMAPATPFPSTSLPHQVEDAMDPIYGLPMALDRRRTDNLANAVSISLAGTPEVLKRDDAANCDVEGDGACSLPVKVWLTNVNGGHNIAAGFSQERQIWVEFTIQNMDPAAPQDNGMPPVVDCPLASLSDFYGSEGTDALGYPSWSPKKLTQDEANHLMDRMTGLEDRAGNELDAHSHPRICRGLSGHLMDKPHDETLEHVADGSLDDEDVMLHRIGNTVPLYVQDHADTEGTRVVSWHVADLGFDTDYFTPPRLPDECQQQYEGNLTPMDGSRVPRPDQFHIPGLNPFACELTEEVLSPLIMSMPNLTAVTLEGEVRTISSLGQLKHAVTETSDERTEILYPFPEYPPLLPHRDALGHFHPGERFGLIYATNIFYQTCNCEHGECEGPEEVEVDFGDLFDAEGNKLPTRSYDAAGALTRERVGPTQLHAQVPWLTTYPTLPHVDSTSNHFPLAGEDHVTPESFRDLVRELGKQDPKIRGADCDKEDLAAGGRCGTTYKEAFTFIPLNADHMPNNRSLVMYKAQRHYVDVRVPADVKGPLRVTVRAWYRHFPPEFLRLMSRFMVGAYRRACAEGKAPSYFPNGPLVIEGEEMRARFPNALDVDKLKRKLLDEAVFYVGIDEPLPVPENPTWARDVQPIIADNCMPCHTDVLRHGNLILGYDAVDLYDYPKGQPDPNPARDPMLNLVGVGSKFDDAGRPLVVPGDAEGSLLMALLTKDTAALRSDGVLSRPMPLKTDPLSPRQVETIRRWIEQGAK